MPQEKTDRPSTRQRYRIQEKLDTGGMAEIYLATAESIEGITRQVAIKRVLPSLTKHENFIRMFVDEARLSIQLTHGNIVQVFDVGRSGESYYIVMEFVEGYNLRRIFQRASELGYVIPLEVACFMIMEVCKGLAYAHEKKDSAGRHLHIVHRDLSPPNVLVSKAGEVKITDFGLAKARTQTDITDPGVIKGKFSYLSPEAANGLNVDHRADIFSTGIVLWELLSKRRLFVGQSDADTVTLVQATKVPSLAKFHPGSSPEFEQILGRALTQDPSRRYTSAREFGESIAKYLFAHKLQVTGFDVSNLLSTLFGEKKECTGPDSQQLIANLIQEEILNLSMMGKLGFGTIDGSRPVDVNDLSLQTNTRLALDSLWPTNEALGGAADDARSGQPQENKLEARRLLRLLEGGEENQGEDPTSKDGRSVAPFLIFVAVVSAALLVYFLLKG
jgi:serine/threonine protein kinase